MIPVLLTKVIIITFQASGCTWPEEHKDQLIYYPEPAAVITVSWETISQLLSVKHPRALHTTFSGQA